jgi:hypothetical protein
MDDFEETRKFATFLFFAVFALAIALGASLGAFVAYVVMR